jgi:hypothetical protein
LVRFGGVRLGVGGEEFGDQVVAADALPGVASGFKVAIALVGCTGDLSQSMVSKSD